MRKEETTGFKKARRVIWGKILRIECNHKSLWEYIKEKLLKVTNILYLPRPKCLRFTCFFRKTPTDFGDKVVFCPLFRKQNVRTSEEFPVQEEQQQQETID